MILVGISTWMSQEVSKWSVNGLFHLLIIIGIYWEYSPLILTFDPNFLPHPSNQQQFQWTICFKGLPLPGSTKCDQDHPKGTYLIDQNMYP